MTSPAPRSCPASSSLLVGAMALALFGTVFGAKLIYIGLGGSDLPNWDQWDAEAINLLQPWFEGRFHWIDLFKTHNEHRVALTKLLCLAEVTINGQWDARLQCVINAAMHSTLVVLTWLWLRRIVTTAWARTALFLVLVGLTATPMAWQNLLGGFHSQQIFLLGLSLIPLALMDVTAWSGKWWFAFVCAALALFSMASGFFAAAVIFGIVGLDALRFHIWRERAPTLSAALLIVIAGWLLKIDYPPHEPLKAHTLHDFFLSFWRALQWPVRDYVIFGMIAWIPWCWLVTRVWRAGAQAATHERVLVGVGGWVLLQYLAAAYARGAGAEWPANRYMDTQALGLLTNAVAIVLFLTQSTRVNFFSGLVFAAAWAGLLAQGLAVHFRVSFSDLGAVRAEMARNEMVTRAYLASNDRALLEREKILPYPSADGFAQRIDPPVIRAIMPVSVRAPLAIEAATHGGNFLSRDVSLHAQPPLDTPKDPSVRDGTSPATHALEYQTTWGTFGAKTPSEWESEPLTLHGGWLKFDMAGDTDASGVSLQLLDARTRRMIAEIRPNKPSHDSWRAAYVPIPSRAFVIVAKVGDPAHWLAFSQPTEMAPLSHVALILVKNGAWILWISAGMLVAITGVSLVLDRRADRLGAM
jgi:hypothetical protein